MIYLFTGTDQTSYSGRQWQTTNACTNAYTNARRMHSNHTRVEHNTVTLLTTGARSHACSYTPTTDTFSSFTTTQTADVPVARAVPMTITTFTTHPHCTRDTLLPRSSPSSSVRLSQPRTGCLVPAWSARWRTSSSFQGARTQLLRRWPFRATRNGGC